ncbi:hypothetical protein AMECASPLE_007884 [Ameca splendens]|uniref:Uncharacterized protein n=1 Tax=Ameca splendens TaxID=208324 RepID=A0ABV0YY09_9TELE
MTAANLQLLSPQWPLIIFTDSLVVRKMDALLVVKQCSCSVDQPIMLEAANTNHTLRATCFLTHHCGSTISVVLLKQSHMPLLQCSTAVTEQKTSSFLHIWCKQKGCRANVFTIKCMYREGEIICTGLQRIGDIMKRVVHR